ncbi:MAG: hypothetical protein N0E59_18230 [Candidatus Thiodiazotropha taylori]|nr:hypothetical protein [Candidatus Thiodiazotropha taylori]MCG8095572.1 hypothetical protein [Candidatus Thiodiazotropha endolucinida]MCG8051936.1 hypothetical protein [Candidatus Thiodiazotropha taylori]MCG8106397.1 hypothetical protein [Candidatus Thiodiazotropha taylori]MCG8112698.1 hypothetical protein [Candidatus Thiodiazotropha taylori]
MPLSDEEQQNVQKAVEDVILKDYFDDFLDVYGTTISIAESHPEQINNEIRNALTHLARAYEADNLSTSNSNIQQARAHIERAKRDSLKLSIITKRDQIHSEIFRIEVIEGAVPRPLKTKIRNIEKARRGAFRKETQGESVTTILEEILVDALELEDQLLTQYQDPGTITPKLKQYWIKTARFAGKASLAIVLSIIAGVLVLLALPENSTFVVEGREVISDLISSPAEERDTESSPPAKKSP